MNLVKIQVSWGFSFWNKFYVEEFLGNLTSLTSCQMERILENWIFSERLFWKAHLIKKKRNVNKYRGIAIKQKWILYKNIGDRGFKTILNNSKINFFLTLILIIIIFNQLLYLVSFKCVDVPFLSSPINPETA